MSLIFRDSPHGPLYVLDFHSLWSVLWHNVLQAVACEVKLQEVGPAEWTRRMGWWHHCVMREHFV